jgi:hypothetical protein
LKVQAHFDPSTIAHEVGHALGLYHTFNNGKCLNGNPNSNELNDSSNCETAGDYVCDTGAAPDPQDQDNYGHCIYNLTTCEYIDIDCVDPIGMPYTNVDMNKLNGLWSMSPIFYEWAGQKE